MERSHEERKTQESSRRGSWQVGWAGAQRGQAAGQPRKWSQGRLGQKSQEENRSPAQRPASSARSPQELIETVIASIRARFGNCAIGLGNQGIRFVGEVGSWEHKQKSQIQGGDGDSVCDDPIVRWSVSCGAEE